MTHFAELIDQLPLLPHLVLDALRIVNQGEGSEDERRAEWLRLFYFPDPVDGHSRALMGLESPKGSQSTERDFGATTRTQWEILASRAGKVRPALLGGLYFDLLWRERRRHDLPRPHEFARAAIAKYEFAVRERLGNRDLFGEALDACQHLGRLARELNDSSGVLLAAHLMGELIDSVRSEWDNSPAFPLRTAQAIETLIRAIPPGRRDANPRAFQCAESLFEEAIARANAGDLLVAASLMTDAAEKYTALGDAERAAAAKKKTRALFAAGTGQMKPMVVSTVVDAAPFIDWVERMAQGSLHESLLGALRGDDLVPNWQLTRDLATQQADKHPLQSLIPAMQVVDGRPVSREDSGIDEMIRSNWLVAITGGVQMLWNPLLEKLKLEKGLTPEKLIEELVQAQVVPSHNQQAARRAVEAALNGDFLVSCHMLPPIIESGLRHVFAAEGIDMNAFRATDGGKIQERTLGVLFDDDRNSNLVQKAIAVLGEDL